MSVFKINLTKLSLTLLCRKIPISLCGSNISLSPKSYYTFFVKVLHPNPCFTSTDLCCGRKLSNSVSTLCTGQAVVKPNIRNQISTWTCVAPAMSTDKDVEGGDTSHLLCRKQNIRSEQFYLAEALNEREWMSPGCYHVLHLLHMNTRQ